MASDSVKKYSNKVSRLYQTACCTNNTFNAQLDGVHTAGAPCDTMGRRITFLRQSFQGSGSRDKVHWGVTVDSATVRIHCTLPSDDNTMDGRLIVSRRIIKVFINSRFDTQTGKRANATEWVSINGQGTSYCLQVHECEWGQWMPELKVFVSIGQLAFISLLDHN